MTILYLIFGATVWYFCACLTIIFSKHTNDPIHATEPAIMLLWPIYLFFTVVIRVVDKLKNVHIRFIENLHRFVKNIIIAGTKNEND